MTDTQPSMLEIHNQALEEVDEAYHKFLLIYRRDAQCVYGFVEGKDDPVFYNHLIERQLPEGWSVKLIPTGNKQKVLRSFHNINWTSFSKERVCFFIDRDLQDFVAPPLQLENNIYVTDGYSIENSICQYQLLYGVLSDVYQITLLDPQEEDLIKQIIQKNMENFFEAMMPLMGQILLWKRLGAKANLSNLRLDHIFSFSEAVFVTNTRSVLLETASRQTGCALDDDNDVVTAEEEIRSCTRPWMLVRGKYVLWFFVKQCEAIWEAIPKLLSSVLDKPKKRTECGLHNAMLIFAPRARVPKSLKEFVERNYLTFINARNNISVQLNNSNAADG
ncbi:DUF4435 domain-containing protein [Synechococcus elongatus IITB4]|uniref:DUF4435 domain-containing protein n=1 Tax=Synechococcus elongatus TaxID=32046 RepID=UPI0030D1C9C3